MTRSLKNLARPRLSSVRIYFKSIFYLFVITAFSVCSAGSYEDFFRAIQLDDGPAVSALLARGFDGNTRDAKGEPGLYLAARDKSMKAAAALMAWHKIDVEARTVSDESALMLAALNGNTDLAQQLIAKGADVNKTGWAPLHYAATRGHLQMISLLLDKYAYIDAASPNGTTPLMMAAFYGTPPAVKLLLDAGADPLLKNDQGMTAIDFAQKNNRADSAELIAASVRAKQPSGKW
jgi:ankyrin repeat protein